jgi:hypothetical protein
MQYQRWGTPEFSRKYTAHSGDVEREAYDRENQIRLALSQPRWANPPGFGQQQVAMQWQRASMCVTSGGTCPVAFVQPVGSNCGCSDAMGRPWAGIAR